MELDNDYKCFLNMLITIGEKLDTLDETLLRDSILLKKYISDNKRSNVFNLLLEKEFKKVIDKDIEHKRFFLKFLLCIKYLNVELYILNLHLCLAESEQHLNSNVNIDRINFINYFLSLDIKKVNFKKEILECYEYAILFAVELNDNDLILKITDKIKGGA